MATAPLKRGISTRARAPSDQGRKSKIPPNAKIVKEGELKKLGAVRKAWRARYFVLRGGVLEYYTDKAAWQDGRDPKGQITLNGARACKSKELEQEKKSGIAINTEGSDRVYLLACANPDDQGIWLEAIDSVIHGEFDETTGSFLRPSTTSAGPTAATRATVKVEIGPHPEIDLDGWLMRKGNGIGGVGLKSWTKRYFRLTPVSFSMYKNEKDTKPMTVISIGSVDSVDYFQTKRVGNRFDVLSHDEYGSSLTCLYATDAKQAVRWCRRIRKAIDEWEITREKMTGLTSVGQQQRKNETTRPTENEPHLTIRSGSGEREHSASSREPSVGPEGRTKDIDNLLAEIDLGDLEEPTEDAPEPVDESYEEKKGPGTRDQETDQLLATGHLVVKMHDKPSQDFDGVDSRLARKKQDLERALQELQDGPADDDDDSEAETDNYQDSPEKRAFPELKLPSLVDIFTQLSMTNHLPQCIKQHLTSLDLLDLPTSRLNSLLPTKGPRGRLLRYLEPFAQAKREAEVSREMRNLERSLERMAAELSRVGASIQHLDKMVIHTRRT